MCKILIVGEQGMTKLLEHILSEDGLDVYWNLWANTHLAHMPIIFFPSASVIENKIAAFGFRANDYIIKPVYPQELKVGIKALTGNGRNGYHG